MSKAVEELETKVRALAADVFGEPFWKIRIEVEGCRQVRGYQAFVYRAFDCSVPTIGTVICDTPEAVLGALADELCE